MAVTMPPRVAPDAFATQASLLVVEDDATLRELLAGALATVSPRVRTAATLTAAEQACVAEPPDLVLLDLTLPDGDGACLVRRLHQLSGVPIIVLTGRDDEAERLDLLAAGADDFLRKPCSVAEVEARVRGVLRRAGFSRLAKSYARFRAGDVEVDLVAQRVTRGDVACPLTPTEWAILRALCLQGGRPLTARQLWDLVWAREFGDAGAHVRVHIANLRRKIEPDPEHPTLVVTEPGVGYRIALP